jgi:hypothetical protein
MEDETRRTEAWQLWWVITDLARLEAWGQLGPEGRSLLMRCRTRYAWVTGAGGATPPRRREVPRVTARQDGEAGAVRPAGGTPPHDRNLAGLPGPSTGPRGGDAGAPGCRGVACARMTGVTVSGPPGEPIPTPPPPPPAAPRGPLPGECRLCGSAPAADVSFRQHVGMVLLMNARSRPGPFCRSCGIATFRDLQNRTLLTGWWGVLSLLVLNWATILQNLRALVRVRRLAPPVRNPSVISPLPAPLPPGRPLWRRPGPLVPLLLAAVAATLVVRAATSPEGVDPTSDSLPGRCVTITGGRLDSLVDCSGPHDGVIVQRLPGAGDLDPCVTGEPFRFLLEDVVLCVDRSR